MSSIYPQSDDQLQVAYLVLSHSLVYRSFQAVGKAVTRNRPLLPFIYIRCKGYILSPFECAWREEGRYRSNSPPPFKPVVLGVTIVVPTLVDCPRRRRRKTMGNVPSRSPLPVCEELAI